MHRKTKPKYWCLFYSDNGGTYELAKEVAKGIESEKNTEAVIKQVKASSNSKLKNIPVASVDELKSYDGIAFGSPVYFGNISTGMSEFLSKLSTCGQTMLWKESQLQYLCPQAAELVRSWLYNLSGTAWLYTE